jgi:hypothetical protein
LSKKNTTENQPPVPALLKIAHGKPTALLFAGYSLLAQSMAVSRMRGLY